MRKRSNGRLLSRGKLSSGARRGSGSWIRMAWRAPSPHPPGPIMLSYKEYDNAQAVEIVLNGRVSTEEFDKIAGKLEAYIARHGQIRVLEIAEDFEGMDAIAFWHDVKFSLRHLHD